LSWVREYSKIDDKKAQRILKKLVETSLARVEGKAKATEYVIPTADVGPLFFLRFIWLCQK